MIVAAMKSCWCSRLQMWEGVDLNMQILQDGLLPKSRQCTITKAMSPSHSVTSNLGNDFFFTWLAIKHAFRHSAFMAVWHSAACLQTLWLYSVESCTIKDSWRRRGDNGMGRQYCQSQDQVMSIPNSFTCWLVCTDRVMAGTRPSYRRDSLVNSLLRPPRSPCNLSRYLISAESTKRNLLQVFN